MKNQLEQFSKGKRTSKALIYLEIDDINENILLKKTFKRKIKHSQRKNKDFQKQSGIP